MSIRSAMMRAAAGLVDAPAGFGFIGFGVGNTGGNQSTTVTIAKPLGTLENHLMMAFLYSGSGVSYAAANGWSGSSNNNRVNIVWKKATASEPSNYTFTSSANATQSGVIITYSGAIIDVIGAVSLNATPSVAPSVNGTAGGALLAGYGANQASGTFTTPTGMAPVTANSTVQPVSGTFNEALTVTGSTGTRTSTCSTGNSLSQMCSIKPG